MSDDNIIELYSNESIKQQYLDKLKDNVDLEESLTTNERQYSNNSLKKTIDQESIIRKALKESEDSESVNFKKTTNINKKEITTTELHKLFQGLMIKTNAVVRDSGILRKKLTHLEHSNLNLKRNLQSKERELDNLNRRVKILESKYAGLEAEVKKHKNKGGRPRKLT